MVRNLKGGTGTKALARKHQNNSNDGNIRLPSCPAEQFAFISKMFGHGICEAFIDDNTKLNAHIRNKFRGRQKRQNTVTPNSIVLVGLREWETSPSNCDILFIYDDNHLHTINNLPNPPHNLLKRINHNFIDNSNSNSNYDLEFNMFIDNNDNINNNHNNHNNHNNNDNINHNNNNNDNINDI